MTSPRSFRSAKSMAEALSELRRAAGTQFDPAVVEALVLLAERAGEELMDVDVSAEDFDAAILESALSEA
jgi:HD-GYP domain-containing protein (c-di-GMP phosphodiesterase class II)